MITIRKLLAKDKDSLTQLLVEFDKDTKVYVTAELLPYETCKDTELNIKETVEDYLTNSKYLIFAAEEEGHLLGYVCGEVQEKKYREFDKVGYVIGLFVKKEYRGKHIGKDLLDQITTEFKNLGCSYLSLDTFSGNTPAIDAYHKLGFHDRLLSLVKRI